MRLARSTLSHLFWWYTNGLSENDLLERLQDNNKWGSCSTGRDREENKKVLLSVLEALKRFPQNPRIQSLGLKSVLTFQGHPEYSTCVCENTNTLLQSQNPEDYSTTIKIFLGLTTNESVLRSITAINLENITKKISLAIAKPGNDNETLVNGVILLNRIVRVHPESCKHVELGAELLSGIVGTFADNNYNFIAYTQLLMALLYDKKQCSNFSNKGGYAALFNLLTEKGGEEYAFSGVLDVLLKTLPLFYNNESIIPFTDHIISFVNSNGPPENLVGKTIKYLFYVSLHGKFGKTQSQQPQNEVNAIISSIRVHPDNVDTLLYGALALNRIAQSEPSRISEVIEKGADEVLFCGMRSHIRNRVVQRICAMVLSNLVTHTCTKYTLLVGLNNIKESLEIHRGDAEVNIAIFGLLGRIAVSGGEEAKITIAKSVILIKDVFAAVELNRGNTDLLLSGLVLVKRVFSSKKVIEKIHEGDNDSVIKLCMMLREGRQSAPIVVQLCKVLSLLAQNAIWVNVMHTARLTQGVNTYFTGTAKRNVICSCCDLLNALYANSDFCGLESNVQSIITSLDAVIPCDNEEVTTRYYELISVLMDKGKERVVAMFSNRTRLDKLIRTLEKFRKNAPILNFCYKILLYIFKFNKALVCQQGDFQKILGSITTSINDEHIIRDNRVQNHGLNILVLMTTVQKIEINAEDILKVMATHAKDSFIQQVGCNLLRMINVSNNDELLLTQPTLAILTHPEDKNVQRYALVAINTALKRGVRADIECDPIISTMTKFPECDIIQTYGLLILYRMISLNPEITRRDGFIRSLIEIFSKYNSINLICIYMHILEKIAFLDGDSIDTITREGGVCSVVNHIIAYGNEGRGNILVTGLYALASFISNEAVCEFLLRQNLLTNILYSLKGETDYSDMRLFAWGFAVIGKLSRYSTSFRLFLTSNYFHYFVARVMSKCSVHSYESKNYVLQAGCFALANMMYEYSEILPESSVVRKVVSAINSSSNPETRVYGCSALCNLCDSVYSPRAIMDIPDFFSDIVSWTDSKSPKVQQAVVETMGLLGRVSTFRVRIVAHGGIQAILKVARQNFDNRQLRSVSVAVLAIMTHQRDLYFDRKMQTGHMSVIRDHMERCATNGGYVGYERDKAFLEAGAFAIEVLNQNDRTDGKAIRDSLTILWNVAPYYNESNNLCKGEVQILMNHIIRNDENMKYALCVLSKLADSGKKPCLPLAHIVREALSEESIECEIYALRILENATCVFSDSDSGDECVKQLFRLIETQAALRLPVMRALDNLSFMFIKGTSGPMAEGLVKMLDTLDSCEVPLAFVKYYFRTLMCALSEDSVHEKYFDEDARVAVIKLHERYGGLSATVDKCSKAIMREGQPEIANAYERNICTCNTMRLCKCCPARDAGIFCESCCYQQEIFVCDVCRHSCGAKKKFCKTCWDNTHNIGSRNETHTYTKRYIAAICDNMRLQINLSSLDDF